MADETKRDAYRVVGGQHVKTYTAPTKTAADVAAAQHREKVGTTAGSGLGAKGRGGAGMPKQSDYASTAEWQAAMRKWREAGPSEKVAGQKAAIKGMSKK